MPVDQYSGRLEVDAVLTVVCLDRGDLCACGTVFWPSLGGRCVDSFLLSEVTFVPVDRHSGRLEVDAVLNALRPNTCMVSVMMANHETGLIQVRNRSQQVAAGRNRSQQAMGSRSTQVLGASLLNVNDRTW